MAESDSTRTDWAPRVGFAWTVRPKTVIRSGGGIFYAPEGNIFDDLGLNPPTLAVQSFNYSTVTGSQPYRPVAAGFPGDIHPSRPQQSHGDGTQHGGNRVNVFSPFVGFRGFTSGI